MSAMFSYRHAFHAGNHADVLKHLTLLAVLRHLMQKDTAIALFDTHAGAGLYRLDSDFAQTSGEAEQGFVQLLQAVAQQPTDSIAPALRDYLDLVASFNQPGQQRVYPGSPFIMQRLMRERDRLKLFELHPTDTKTLRANVAQLEAGRMVTVLQEDGFGGLKKFLPPPSRRALVLCDPSYELKSDYLRVQDMMEDNLKRFATGTYLVWYPIIPRPEAHDLPRRLKTLSNKATRPWLHATLTVKSSKTVTDEEGKVQRPGLPASGMFVINPPHTLKAQLKDALNQVSSWIGQGKNQSFQIETGT
jgi:23S rRNA (adenine2030-N6)-methyltransferase